MVTIPMEKMEPGKDSNGLKRALDDIKPYILFISFLPLLLGGLIQVVNLLLIGLSYLRFFSTTQLIQDGVTGLVILGIFLIPAAYYYSALREGGTSRIIAIWYHYLLVLISTGLFLLQYVTEGEISYITLFVIIMAIIYLIIKLVYKFKLLSRTTYNVLLNVFALISFSVGIWGIVKVFNSTNNIDSSSTLGNLDNIKCIINSEPYPVDSFRILYFNDKYIFTEITTDTKSQIRIFPFEEMFNSAECKNPIE